MKAEELMIGYWVRVSKDVCIKKDTVVKILSIDGDNSFPARGLKGSATCEPIDDRTFSGGVWVEFLKPIPLTPEILEKIGFKKDTGGEECWGCKIGWLTPHHYNRKYFPTSWEVQICARNSFSGVIKYVHQLQAALRLCKIKKEIVL